jgi:hypothetical protein
MQIYLKPYAHKTYTNVPYAPAKDKNVNSGYLDLYNYPAKINQVPELKNNPELRILVEQINQHELYTFGCGLNWDPVLQATGWHEFSSYVNLAFVQDEHNLTDKYYLKLAGTFLLQDTIPEKDAVTINFIINPTNFHSFQRFSKGVKPKEETVTHRGFSLNLSISGLSEDPKTAVAHWAEGVQFVTDFFRQG